MVVQSAVNVTAVVDPSRVDSLRSMLRALREHPGSNDIAPFAHVGQVHFARLLILPAVPDRRGGLYPPMLVLAMNVDGDGAEHLRALVAAGGAGLAGLCAHCRDFPPDANERATLDFLLRHRVPVNAFYINTVGRSLAQIELEAGVHDEFQRLLDSGDFDRMAPLDIRHKLIEHLRTMPALAAALEPAPQPETLARPLVYALIGVLALVGLALAIVLLPLTLLAVAVLRLHEIGNRAEHYRPSNARVRTLESDEDHGLQNQFSATGYVQRGPFRWLLLRVALFGLAQAARHVFNRGKLAEVDTIHFARWVLLDGGRRLYFFSNYDGSPESYQDDFIERVAFGLNLVFSNGTGWPRTHYLLFGGAGDEQSFKAFYRDHQVQTDVWYRAPVYAGFSAVNLANNAAIRAGLCGEMDEQACRAWLRRL